MCPKKDIIKEGGRPRDVKTQAQVSKAVVRPWWVEGGVDEEGETV